MASPPFRPATGPNAASKVLAELARLWDRAVDKGEPLTQKRLAKDSKVPLATVNSWATGKALPRDLDALAAVGAVLSRWAGEDPPPTQQKWARLLQVDKDARAVELAQPERPLKTGVPTAPKSGGARPGRIIAIIAGLIIFAASIAGVYLSSRSRTPGPRLLATLNYDVYSVAFSSDGRLASGDRDGAVHLWNIATRHDTVIIQSPKEIDGVAFSPDGQTLASAGGDSLIRLWKVGTGKITVLPGHKGVVDAVAFSPDGRTLASGGRDGTVRLWDVATGRAMSSPLRPPPTTAPNGHGYVYSVAFSRDGTLATGYHDGTVWLWDIATGRSTGPLLQDDRVWSVAFSPDGTRLATGSNDKLVRLLTVPTGHSTAPLPGHRGAVDTVAFSLNGTLATGDRSGMILLWEVATEKTITTFPAHQAIYSIAFSPDGKTLAAGSGHTIQLWQVPK